MKTQTDIALDTENDIGHSIIWEIDSFPKEFRKNWLAALDYRFLSILLITSISAILSLSLMRNIESTAEDVQSVPNFHEHYARLLIQEQPQVADDVAPSVDQIRDTYLFGVENVVRQVPGTDADPIAQGDAEAPVSESSPASSSPVSSRRANTEFSSEEKRARNVEGVGLFKYLATDSRGTQNTSDAVLSDISDTDGYSAVANLDGKQMKRYTAQSGDGSSEYSLRGSKLEDIGIDDVVGSLSGKGNAEAKVVVKNIDWDQIPSTDEKTAPERRRDGLTRSPEEISKILLAHNRTIQDCYKQALRQDNGLKGKIVVKFTVTPDGEVTEVHIVNSNLKNGNLERCILRRIKRWKDFGFCDPDIGDLTYRQTYVFGY
ncbi:MAG: AgmX/PglI C-terminal domain-containing protein [candidate division KSB1 bacterium]|jgi:TonB family protein|nr:AgmX/PglI C-terminal domain-containing protein [candidate division KSB1 bacterium]